MVHTKFEIGTEFSLKYYCLILAEIVISSTVLYALQLLEGKPMTTVLTFSPP